MTATMGDPLDELVAANRILFDQGVLDAFGHVSVRSAPDAASFLLARNMAPALVTATDILRFDLDGRTDDARPVYLERFIHGAIYRARPDVMAVVHSHSQSVIPFGVAAEMPLRPVFHMCGFLGAGAARFEIRDTAGDTSDLLIRDAALGAALARALGEASVVLMRGHGATIVGGSLRQAVFRAVYTEVGAKIQADACRLGAVTYLTPQEAEAAARSNDGQLDRAWSLWRAQAML